VTLQFEYLDPDEIIGSEDFRVVESFLKVTGRTQIGWHYVIDLTWIYSRAKHWPVGSSVLDAGGGTGPAQFLLAEMGMNVVNADLLHPNGVPYYAARYRAGVRRLGSYTRTDYVDHLRAVGQRPNARWRQRLRDSAIVRAIRSSLYVRRHDRWKKHAALARPVGRIEWVEANLSDMPEIPSHSFDAVVSLSALEHVPLPDLSRAVAEIQRVAKPSAQWAITTSGSTASSWFHAPSRGMCFDRPDLESIFGASFVGADDAMAILARYGRCAYLRDHLADFYRTSGDNGMPWANWDPKYVPVGIANRL
jgi:SAM-dependent methyltransferase